jgi:flagellar protein FlgJ
MNRSEFVAIVAPIASKLWQDGSGVLFPSIRLAQTILETGGKIHDWNNLVGYKVGSGVLTKYWKGRSVNTSTWEVYNDVVHTNVKANWRAYDSIEDCFRDQDLLFQLPRYADVRSAKTPEDQAVSLYRCGYATDPDYYKKLIAIAAPYKVYDVAKGTAVKEVKPEMDKGVGKTIVNTWMKPSYEEAKTQKEKEYIRWLANQVRKACGMKEDEEFE